MMAATADIVNDRSAMDRNVGGLSSLSLAIGAWASCGLLLGGMPLGGGLYVSQILLITLFVPVLMYQCGRGRFRMSAAALLTVIVLLLWVILIGAQGNSRFVPELLKLLLLIGTAIVFSDVVTWVQVRVVAAVIPWLACAMMIGVQVVGVGDYFGYGESGRFGVPWWGSPNSSGFVIAIVMACLLFTMRLHANVRPSGLYAILGRLARVVMLFTLGTFLVLTDSQGGLLCGGVVLLRFAGFGLRTIFGLLAGAVAVVVAALWLVPSFELPELVGSGRLVIWATLLSDLFERGVTSWLFGVGPGAVDYEPWFTARVLSAHSMYVEVLYAFGLTGLLIMLAGIRSSFRALRVLDRKDPRRVFLEAVFGAVVAGFVVDTYLLGAQLTWFGALMLSWIGLVANPVNSTRAVP